MHGASISKANSVSMIYPNKSNLQKRIFSTKKQSTFQPSYKKLEINLICLNSRLFLVDSPAVMPWIYRAISGHGEVAISESKMY